MFKIGTLDIQTAGISSHTDAAESLNGLPNLQAVYETLAEALRRFRGARVPTAGEMETALTPTPET